MERFIAKNPWFSYVSFAFWLTITWVLFVLGVMPLVLSIVVSLCFILSFPIMPLSCSNRLLNKAIVKLNNECDPYPLGAEIEDQLTYVKNAAQRQLLMINYSAVLDSLGKYKESYDQLMSVDINLVVGTLFEQKALYYLNLCNVCLEIGDYEASLAHHARASQILGLAKNKKAKESLFASLRLTAAEQAIYRKDFDTAISLLATVEDKSKRTSVEKAFMYGEIMLAQGKTDVAKGNLLYVINNGNKLYLVQKANEILSAL